LLKNVTKIIVAENSVFLVFSIAIYAPIEYPNNYFVI